jgi:hypothetical protein
MIPVHSILEVNADWTAFGFSYLSHSFGDGKTPRRITYVPAMRAVFSFLTISFPRRSSNVRLRRPSS